MPMRTADIQVGKTYTNGKGRYRKVTDRGAQFKLYPEQSDDDCVRYEEYEKRGNYLSPKYRGQMPAWGNMTRNSFAKWAKEEVK